MDQERLSAFINAFDTDRDPFLDSLEKEALSQGIPIIRHEMISFLQIILEIKKPGRILEVGTATGFSALVMASFTAPDCSILTIEQDPQRAGQARQNFIAGGMENRITLLEGDADPILADLAADADHARRYDLVFMDAAKAQYIHFLPKVQQLLRSGGLLISDNVLQEGDLLESKYLVQRRDRTIYKRMREYLYALKHDPAWHTSIIPIADGVALSVRTEVE